MPTGERGSLFYINRETGELTLLEDINEIIMVETEPAGDFQRIKTKEKYQNTIKVTIKEKLKVRRILYFGDNNRRKMNHLPMYRRPAWGRRRKKHDKRRSD